MLSVARSDSITEALKILGGTEETSKTFPVSLIKTERTLPALSILSETDADSEKAAIKS
jgi:hypothetical protein